MRQTQGFTKSVFDLLGLDLPVDSAATLCRRRKALSIKPWARNTSEPLDLVLDSTGLKIFGQGEWCWPKHGRKPQRWRKVDIDLVAKGRMAWQKNLAGSLLVAWCHFDKIHGTE
ncbi:MAG: transposase [Geminicoccaceae bacterium]